jgi:hypothetical protein
MNQNWSPICTIPVPTANSAAGATVPSYNLLIQPGRMTLVNIRVFADTYQFFPDQKAQNAHQMYELLYASLNDDVQVRVAVKEAIFRRILKPFSTMPQLTKITIDLDLLPR